ncbi:hypothetical protein ACFWUP_22550 [Nocardia sp. NPDC058658]|uniref:hypothetical protein n=1 Tax=Nocardia sp. NPDC058658 TaxID=3346580 RepID=UPI00365D94F1
MPRVGAWSFTWMARVGAGAIPGTRAGSRMTRRSRIEPGLTGLNRTTIAGRGELGSGPPIRVRNCLVAIGVLTGRHPAFPWRARRPSQGRVVVVVTPMSGIIVAHHASCTRRNPRIPPVR